MNPGTTFVCPQLPVRDLESSVNQKKRVAAYCLITRNLKNRIKFRNANELLKNMILNNSEWEFAGIFSTARVV